MPVKEAVNHLRMPSISRISSSGGMPAKIYLVCSARVSWPPRRMRQLTLALLEAFSSRCTSSRSCGVIGKVVNVTADDSVLVNGQLDMSLVNAIAFDTYTHGYYKVTERVGEAFQEGLKLKK